MLAIRVCLLGAMIALTSCAGTMSEQEYGNAFLATCEKYFAIAKEIDAKPLPSYAGLDRKQRFEVMAKFLRENTQPLSKLADEVRSLKPPTAYQALHREWLEMLDGQVARETKHAAAVEAQDRDTSSAINDELISFLSSQLRSVIDEVMRSEGNSPELRKYFDEMLKEANL